MFRVPGSCYALFQCSVAPYQDTALGAARRRNNSTLSPNCCVSAPCPVSGHLVSRFGRAITRNYARCHHAGRTFHVSKCCVSVPCSWVLVIRDFDSRSYYSAAPLSLCHQAGRQCDAGPRVAWVVCVPVSYHTRLQHMETR